MSDESDTVPAMLERGRYTVMLPGETHLEAHDRLMRGEPGAEVDAPPHIRKLLEEANHRPSPHFRPGGKR